MGAKCSPERLGAKRPQLVFRTATNRGRAEIQSPHPSDGRGSRTPRPHPPFQHANYSRHPLYFLRGCCRAVKSALRALGAGVALGTPAESALLIELVSRPASPLPPTFSEAFRYRKGPFCFTLLLHSPLTLIHRLTAHDAHRGDDGASDLTRRSRCASSRSLSPWSASRLAWNLPHRANSIVTLPLILPHQVEPSHPPVDPRQHAHVL